MNPLERVIEAISPGRALRRELARRKLELVQNSGYSNYGANRYKSTAKGWMDGGGSSREDIEDNLPTLRQRCRDLYMGVPLATGAIKTYRTSVVGEGLSLKPKINGKSLGMSDREAEEIEQQILREWSLWADSTDCDGARQSNFYELQQLAFLNWLMSGDVLVMLPTWKRRGSIYDMRIHLVEADRCMTPPGMRNDLDDKIVDGVERDRNGEVIAYHIAKKHPLGRSLGKQDYVRVEAYGKRTGRRNVVHLMSRERIGQVRGVPILAPVIEALKQIGRYTEAELVAAVVSGLMTTFIETEDPGGNLLGEMVPEEEQIDPGNKGTIEMKPGGIVELAPGEKANAVMPGRPNTSFEGFVAAISKQIGAALELPQELMMKQFTASYSASRGALLEAWKTFNMYRDWMGSGFCQPIYEEWLCEAVARGRVKAPGFFADPAIRRCYMAAEWYGPSQGQLDPKKEVEAAGLRVQYGFSTGAKEAMELTSTNFAENCVQIRREREMQREAGMNPEAAQTGGQTEGQKTGENTREEEETSESTA